MTNRVAAARIHPNTVLANTVLANMIMERAIQLGTWEPRVIRGQITAYDYYLWAMRGDYTPERERSLGDRPGHPETFGMTAEEFRGARDPIYAVLEDK